MIKILSIDRMDNLKTFFTNSNAAILVQVPSFRDKMQKPTAITRGVLNSDFCRIRIFCRIHFAKSEYSALPNNEENMFKNKKRR